MIFQTEQYLYCNKTTIIYIFFFKYDYIISIEVTAHSHALFVKLSLNILVSNHDLLIDLMDQVYTPIDVQKWNQFHTFDFNHKM